LDFREIPSEIVDGLQSLKNLRIKVTHEQLLLTVIVSAILLIAFTIRLLPMRWGFQLSEFDPYVHYRSAQYAVDNGFFAWVSWRDSQRWYPYGMQTSRALYPGLALTAAFSYKIMQMFALPISLYEYVILFPPIMAVLACLAIYFLGKDIGGKAVGLFSALFLALNGSYIGRTSLGFFDDETIGILAILVLSYAFLRSLDAERTWNSVIKYSILSGLMLGWIFASWGGAVYPFGLLILFAVVLVLLKRYSNRLLVSYSITCGLGLLAAVNVPRLGLLYLTNVQVLAAFAVLAILCLCEIVQRTKTKKWKIFYVSGFLVLLTGIALIIVFGSATGLERKFLTVLNPFERFLSPIVESVQEHRPSAWGSFYFDYGIGILFVVVGLFFAARSLTNRNVFIILYSLSMLYFASSLVRLLIVLAPAFCILWAMGLVGVLNPFITVLKETPKTPIKKKYTLSHVGKEFSGSAIILVMLLLLVTFVLPSRESQIRGDSFPRVFDQAYTPVTIMSSSVPVRPDEPVLEWYETLMWMKAKLTNDAVVASWWDYGYWITIIGNKTTLVDNGTHNLTQIQQVGKMFMSTTPDAVDILKNYDVTHVVVFTTFDSQGTDLQYGDEGKWRWMAKISQPLTGKDDNYFGNYSLGQDQIRIEGQQQPNIVPNANGQNSTLYKLMTYAKETKLGQTSTVQLTESGRGFEPTYFSSGKNYGGIIVLVAVYKVVY